MKTRIILGSILTLIIAAIFFTDIFFKMIICIPILLMIVTSLGLFEFFRITEKKGYKPLKFTTIIFALILIGVHWGALQKKLNLQIQFIMLILTLYIIGLLLYLIFTKGRIKDISISIFGLIYIWFLLSFTLWIINIDRVGIFLLIFIIAITKAGDIGAIFVGKKFGRKKIYPNISPNKTFEGYLGGLFSSIIVAFIFAEILKEIYFSWLTTLVWGIIIDVFGQLGDLVESFIKRQFDVKDSSKLFPEFGGVLDLIDSLILTVPIGYCMFYSLMNGT